MCCWSLLCSAAQRKAGAAARAHTVPAAPRLLVVHVPRGIASAGQQARMHAAAMVYGNHSPYKFLKIAPLPLRYVTNAWLACIVWAY